METPPRIVSLIASATEIVCALGFENQLVGRSHECDYPESVQRLPVCTRPKLDVHANSAEIDRQVRSLVENALAVYDVDAALLERLEPDVIVTQSQCEVCAVSLRDVERAVCAWLRKCPRIVSLKPDSLADVWHDIEQVALALDAGDSGTELIGQLRRRMNEVAERTSHLPERPRVACVEWMEPLMAAGNWVPELVALAGGVNLFGEAGQHAPGMTWEQLVEADPDVIVLMPCGFDLARTLAEAKVLEDKPEWKRLQAVRGGRVYATDGNAYFNRPGPRLVESLEILAEVLHPGTFEARHEGTGWRRPRAAAMTNDV
jgi:iron complex transport system substrate-binding protein